MDFKLVAILLVIPLLLFIPVPMIDSVNPNFGLNNEVVNVVINGDKFDNKATVKLVKPGEADIIATDVKVISKKQLSCSFDLHGQAVGKWYLIVANRSRFAKKDKTATLVEAFTIQYPAPTLSVIEPNHGLNSEAKSANLTGTGFRAGAKVVFYKGNQSVEAADVTVISSTQITSRFNLEKAEPGIYNVIITNDDGKSGSLDGGFEIQYPEPTVSEIEPSQGLNTETVTVNFTGTDFRAGATVELKAGNQVIEATDVEVVSDTQITVVFDLTGETPGIYDVIVTNDDEKSGSLDGGFVIEFPKPTIAEIESGQGLNTETVAVNLIGTDFRAGATVELKAGDQVIGATDVEVVSDTQITAVFELTGETPGIYDVIVTNDDEKSGSLDGGFVIEFPEPTIAEIEPGQVLNTETVTVKLTGTDFRAGTTVELKAGEQVIGATDVEVVSDTQIAAVFDLMGENPGTYDVIVTNDDGKTGMLDGGFEITAEPIDSAATTEDSAVTTEESDVATEDSDVTTEDSDVAAEDSDVTTEDLDVAAEDSDVTTEDSDVVTEDSAATTEDSDVAAEDSDVTTEDSDVAAEDSDVATEDSDVAAEDSDVTTEDSDVSAEDSDVTTEDSDVASEDSDVTTEDSDVTAEDSDVTTEDSDVAAEDSDVTTEDSDVAAEDSAVTTEDSDGTAEDSDVTTEDSDVATEDSDVTTEDSDVAAEDSDVTTEDSDAAAEESDVIAEDSDVAAEDSDVTTEDSDVAIEDSAVAVQELNKQLKPIFFDFDQFEIRPDQIPVLEENVKILNENPGLYILLGGHTDERGTREYNRKLSEKRAEAIKQFLVEKGIDSSQISVYAYGEDHPVKKGHDESSWSYNRRVDILVWESPPDREQGLIKINSDGEED